MKKKILILIMIVFIFVIGFNMFYNGFSEIESMTIQKYDEPFEDGKTTTDKEKIATITGILNRANHLPKNIEYKLAGEPTYKIQLIYNDKNTEVIHVYENFDKNTTLLISNENGYYKINEKQTQKILELLFN